MLIPWMRILEIKLSNDNTTISYTTDEYGDGLNITVTGSKYMSVLKDNCLIKITNLTYDKIVKILEEKFYNVEVVCGYRNISTFTIFKGTVLYISNALESDRSNTVNIICTSLFIAKASSQRLNLSYDSGINYYTMIKSIAKQLNVSETVISEKLAEDTVENTTSNSSALDWLTNILKTNSTYVASTDAATGTTLSIYDIIKDGESRPRINLNSNLIDLSSGYPTLTSSGLTLSVIPTRNYSCGEILKLDNSIIDLSVTSQSEALKYYGNYLDKNGEYVIYQIDYSLSNRSDNFIIDILAKSYNLMSSIAE